MLTSLAEIPPLPPAAAVRSAVRPGPPPRPRRQLRWVARRPPEARPGPPARRRPPPTPTPRYTQIPRWGLHDVVSPPETPRPGRTERAAESMQASLLTLGITLVVAAASQAWIYGLLVVNRDEPISRAMATWAYAISQAVGWVSVVGMVVCAATFWAWMVTHRRRAYRAIDRVDPRPRWQIAVGCLVPLVNVVGAPVLMHELVRCGHHLPADRVTAILRGWWASWVVLNALAVVTLAVRFGADSIQWGANAVLLTLLTDLAGAAFAIGTAWLLYRAFDPSADRAPTTRWLAV
ncbi:DUF4328 domain-containing protein [Williamsia deligens]|uniref:DUF4328 domain-containing protein n=1 Tax=Williamsia deligens TaxID=321325 RepID=A0ABW3G4D3_9NOCA|nr:DUF4328 domain-containing protein [Williamsia deligens]MCP2193919.1 protein of unknown function (DUF4328) [Williamsia deligens]